MTPANLIAPPPRFEARMSLAFAALFLTPGVHVPYFPIWLEAHGFGPGDIAIILALPMFLRVVTTPIITALADRARDRANVLTFLAASAAFLSFGYFLPPAYTTVLVVSLLLAVPWTPHSPMADAVTLSGVRRFGFSYTRMRVWGSISFLIGNLVGGFVLASTDADSVPVMMSAGLMIFLATSLVVPRVGPPRQPSQPSLDALGDAERFSRYFVLAIIGAGLIAGSHAFVNSFMSIYWQSIGYADSLIGLLWSWSIVAEVLLFFSFSRFLGKAKATSILLAAAGFSILRWAVLPLVEPLGLGAAGFFAAQTLHAPSIGLSIIGVQKLISEEVPEKRTGSAQGIAFFANGMGIAAMTLLSGPLYEMFGIRGVWPMVLVAALAALVILLATTQPHRRGSGGKTSEPA